MADDVERQLSRLSAEQLGFQEGGPLLLQQLLTAYVVLREPAASGPNPPLAYSHWLPSSQPSSRPGAGGWGQTLQTLATLDVYSSSKKSNSLAVSSKKK